MQRRGNPRRLTPVSAAGLVILGAFSVQLGSALATKLFPLVGPGTTVLLRTGFAALVVTLAVRPRWEHFRTLTPRGWGILAAYGVSISMMNLSFYHALVHLPLGTTVTIEFLGPLAVALLGSRRPLDLLWAVLALAGVTLIAGFSLDGFSWLGGGFALAAGVCWAVYLLLSRSTTRLLPLREGLAGGLIISAITAAPFGFTGLAAAVETPIVLLVGLGIAILSTALPYGIDLVSLSVVPAGAYGILMSLEPAVAAISGFVVLGQHLSVLQWAALLLVVVASSGSTLAASRAQHQTQAAAQGSGTPAG